MEQSNSFEQLALRMKSRGVKLHLEGRKDNKSDDSQVALLIRVQPC